MSAQRDLDKLILDLKNLYGHAISRKQMVEIGKFASELIRKRTRLGKGVENEGDEAKSLRSMRQHKKSYTNYRKRLKKKEKLHPKTSPGKHNLTLTGQLLDSIGVVKSYKALVKIGPDGYRDDDEANLKIANIVQSRGWIFMNLSKAEQEKIRRFYNKTFLDLLKQFRRRRG